MQINLRTHTVYPEIISDPESGEWLAKLIDRKGKTIDQFKGVATPAESDDISGVIDFRSKVTTAVHARFEKTIKKYVRGKK